MQIPIINGIYTDENSDFRTSYPHNLIPVPKQNGISAGYLRPADGLVSFGTGPGIDRGGINWDDVCYRVMGSKLVSVDVLGAVTTIGDVQSGSTVTLDYSFTYLAVASGENLYLYDKTTLTQVTDTDLGVVIDFIWVDGYFMTTDGTSLVVTELNDPFSVNPLKYGSSEIDPDPVLALLKLNNEPHALNRYTIEIFKNRGGDLFPFIRVESAQINRGTVGTHSCCVFMETITFVGSGRNEAIGVWSGLNGESVKISTREIDQILSTYSEYELSSVVCEARVYDSHQQLYVHLPDQTLVYDGPASQTLEQPVWVTLTTSVTGLGQYRARNFTMCYGKWIAGDPTSASISELSNSISSHFGNVIGWDFGTTIVYNESRGALFHELELVCLTGRSALGDDSTVWTQYSLDGVTFSMEKALQTGKQGERNKRIAWLGQGSMRNWRVQRFRGTSDSMLTIARLDARLEPLSV